MKAKADWLDPRMHHHCVDEYDVVIVGPEAEVERYRRKTLLLEEAADAAANVVAQWRGDISRKPHIGRLREALARVDAHRPTSPEKP